MRLDADDIEAVAARVAELVRDQTPVAARYVDASELARVLGVERDWVYRRWRSLGGVKLGTASNAPVRFDVTRSLELARTLGTTASPEQRPRGRRGRPRTTPGLEPGASLLRGRGR